MINVYINKGSIKMITFVIISLLYEGI